MRSADDGDYVRYADYLAAILEKDARVVALELRLQELESPAEDFCPNRDE